LIFLDNATVFCPFFWQTKERFEKCINPKKKLKQLWWWNSFRRKNIIDSAFCWVTKGVKYVFYHQDTKLDIYLKYNILYRLVCVKNRPFYKEIIGGTVPVGDFKNKKIIWNELRIIKWTPAHQKSTFLSKDRILFDILVRESCTMIEILV